MIRKKAALAALLAAIMTLTACDTGSTGSVSDKESSSAAGGESISADSGTNDATNTSSDVSDTSDTSQNGDSDSSQSTSEEPKADSKDTDDSESSAIALKPSVELSAASGIYAEEFELALTSEEQGEIYYTTDGSDPTKSDTAALYSSPIKVTDRSGDKNVIAAVPPVEIAGSFNQPNKDRNDFISELTAPADKDVDKCTVIRAAVKKPDGSFAGIASATYFIGTPEEHIEGIKASCEAAGTSLAVISITMDYDDLFDSERGIYVKGDIFYEDLETYLEENRKVRDGETARSLDANYKQRGREWEREAAVTFFEFGADGAEEIFTQNCGIRVQGNYSRSDIQKGLRLYARNDYGSKNFKYAVFGEDYVNDSGEVMDKFKTLVLRAGGNCAFSAKYNDTYWQALMEGSAAETKKSRPCIAYMNGEYLGLYVLEEDYTTDFFEDKHGVNKDTVVIYKGDAESYEIGYKLDEGELPEGASEDFYFSELLEFFGSHSDLKEQADFEEFSRLVDTDSVMDYFAAQIWVNNKWDWPGKNWSMWRTTETDPENPYADGRWRLMFYDMEFGGIGGAGEAGTNTIKDDNYKAKGLLDMNTDNPAVLCYAYLMTNDAWKNSFYDRLIGLAENEFEESAALEKLAEFRDIYSPLYEQFFLRYPETGTVEDAVEGYGSPLYIGEFISARGKNIERMIKWCEKQLS